MRRRPQPKSTTPALFRYLKRDGRLMLSEFDGDLWATNSYWCVRAGKEFATLLADYNLPFESMVCDVGLTVKRRVDAKAPDLTSILSLTATSPLQRATICGQAFSFDGGSGIWQAPSGVRVMLSLDKVAFVESLLPSVEWAAQSDALKAVVASHEDRNVALLMPIRNMFSDAATFDVDPLPGVDAAA